MKICTVATLTVISLAIALAADLAAAQPLIYASATAGNEQSSGGAAITDFQFIGTRFQVESSTEVGGIGGFFYTPAGSGDGQMFAAIMRLDSLSSVPSGDPFDAGDLSRVVFHTVVIADSRNPRDYVFPASLTLEPGVYGLIYGKGQFGASPEGSVAAVDGPESLSPHYMSWNSEDGWNNGGFPNARLTVYGVPEPAACALLLWPGLLLMARRRVLPTAPASATIAVRSAKFVSHCAARR